MEWKNLFVYKYNILVLNIFQYHTKDFKNASYYRANDYAIHLAGCLMTVVGYNTVSSCLPIKSFIT
jgi:hypothetical protein